jgi:hypothetical protein
MKVNKINKDPVKKYRVGYRVKGTHSFLKT